MDSFKSRFNHSSEVFSDNRPKHKRKLHNNFKVGTRYNSILDDEDIEYEDEMFQSKKAIDDILFDDDESSKANVSGDTTFQFTYSNKKRAKPVIRRNQRVIEQTADDISKKCLISTDVLPDSFRSVFKFDNFNKMQSEAFPELYEGTDNCVICSPTGSGKTTLFELAVLNLIKNSKDVRNTKVLYIAPTKSLCNEKFKEWGSTFLSLSVGMLTSDTSYLETEKVRNSNIIITTPEKWDLLTRKWNDYARLFELVRLILVDEIHILRERRGATLEAVLTRMNKMCDNMRIVAVSATIPNAHDVSEWLKTGGKNGSPAKTLIFDDSYRQVLLQRHVYGYSTNTNNDFQLDAMYNTRLSEIFARHSAKKPVLIFCSTRNSTVTTTKYITQNCSHELMLSNCDNSFASLLQDRQLRECAKHGVAFHHAGLSMEDRSSIEANFVNGNIKVLCSTSTLAVGVNLPAYLVIIKGTRVWTVNGTEEYSELDTLQMIGRAGRPQFESEGCAVIMTDSCSQKKYEGLIKGKEKLESSLHLNLVEHLAAEVTLGTITSSETAVEWLQNTFFYVRFKANPSAYGQVNKFMSGNYDTGTRLIHFCDHLSEELSKFQIVDFCNGNITAMPYGYAMSRHYVLFETMKSFIKSPKNQSLPKILNLLSMADEFSDIKMKHNQKRLYKEINSSPLLRYPFLTEKKQCALINSREQKLSLLIQYELGGLEFPTYKDATKQHQSLIQDKLFVFRHFHRILKCMVDCFIEKSDGISLKNTLLLLRSINGRCWEDTPMVLRQLNSIGLVSVRKLVNHNVCTLQEMASITDSQIEYFLSLKPGNGLKIRRDLELLPAIRIRTKLEDCILEKNLLKLSFKVEISANFKTSIWHGQNLSLDILTLKKTGELIDFRRIQLSKLRSPKSFRIFTLIGSEKEDIEFSIDCEEVAGIGKTVEFRLKDLPFSHRSSLLENADDHTSSNIHESRASDDYDSKMPSEGSISSNSDDEDILKFFDEPCKPKTVKPPDIGSRKIRPNGNYECNHSCKEKNKCRHLCCKEGIPKDILRNRKSKHGDMEADKVPSNSNYKDIFETPFDLNAHRLLKEVNTQKAPTDISSPNYKKRNNGELCGQKTDGDNPLALSSSSPFSIGEVYKEVEANFVSPSDMASMKDLKKKYGIKPIEEKSLTMNTSDPTEYDSRQFEIEKNMPLFEPLKFSYQSKCAKAERCGEPTQKKEESQDSVEDSDQSNILEFLGSDIEVV